MVVLWMCYATLVTALLVAGAWAADGALAALGRPRRWAWTVAIAAGLALPAWGTWDAWTHPPRPTPAPATWRVVTVAPSALAPLDRWALTAWLLASGAGLAYVARDAWAVRQRRRGWRPAVVAGERVWLAPNLGPALVGALRPRVVLPAWLLDALDADGLRLVLAHERAHAAAGDPLLLAIALGALVVTPWNAALWVAARRLRLAAEADCDRRVLRAHPGARRYARLLVDVAERALGVPGTRGAMATALLDPPGLLERRVEWLLGAERDFDRRRTPQAAGALLGAVGVMALACAVPRPTPMAAPALAGIPNVRVETSRGCAADASCVTERLTATRMDRAAKRMDAAAARMDASARRMNATSLRMVPLHLRAAVRRRLPDLPEAQSGAYSWMGVPAGRDTINLLVVSPSASR